MCGNNNLECLAYFINLQLNLFNFDLTYCSLNIKGFMKVNYLKMWMFIFLIVILKGSSFAFDNQKMSKELSAGVEKILALNKLNGATNYYLITNLDNCVSCQLSAINHTLLLLKKNDPKANINIVIESVNEKDSYYLKNYFTKYYFFEDNEVFLTTGLGTNFVLIKNNSQNKPTILKFSDLKEFTMKGYEKYLTSVSLDVRESKRLQEDSACYLSNICVVDNNCGDLILFDYKNKTLINYDSKYQIKKKLDFTKNNQFYIGEKSLLDTVTNNGLMIDEDLLSINKADNDIYYILYNRGLIDIKVDENAQRGILLKPVLAKYKNDSLVESRVLGINNYIAAFSFKNKHILLNNLPNLGADPTSFLSEVADSKRNSMGQIILNKSIFKKHFNKKIENLDFIDLFEMTNESDFFIVSSKFKAVFLKRDKKYTKFDLMGRCLLKEDYSIESSFNSGNSLFIVLKDNSNYYIQRFDLEKGILENEKVINRQIEGDFLIELVIFKYENGKLTLINRRKTARWFVNNLDEEKEER